MGCHNSSTAGPLAFIPEQLNLNVSSIDGGEWNQIRELAQKSILTSSNIPNRKILPYSEQDTVSSANSYLQVHCGSCHNSKGGPGRGDFSFEYKPFYEYSNYCEIESLNLNNSAENSFLVDSQNPMDSALMKRLISTDPKFRMPKMSGPTNKQSHLDSVYDWLISQNCN